MINFIKKNIPWIYAVALVLFMATIGGFSYYTNQSRPIGDVSTPAYFKLLSGNVQFVTTSWGLKTNASTTFNGVKYMWPAADGSPNQRLTTDGNGNLSWATVTATIPAGTYDPYGQATSTLLSFTGGANGYYATTTHPLISSLPSLSITKSQVSDFGTYLTSYDAFTHPAVGQSATTSLMVLNGNASTTQLTSTGSTYLATTGGNVGIGTTTPASKLAIFGGGSTSAASPVINLQASSTASMWNGYWTMGSDLADAGKFKISSSTDLGTNTRLTIDGSGNVGIGTTAPNGKLIIDSNDDIYGVYINSGAINYTSLLVTGEQDGNDANTIRNFTLTSNPGGNGGAIYGLRNEATAVQPIARFWELNSSSNQPTLSIENDGTGNAIFINQDGNGIALNIDSEATTTNGVVIDTNVMTSGNALTVDVDSDLLTGDAIRVLGSTNHATNVFNIDALGAGYFAGNVGIGTTTPTSLLQIANATAPKLTISDTDASANQKHWFIESNTGSFAIGTTSDALITNTAYRALTINNAGLVSLNNASSSLFSSSYASSTLGYFGSITMTGDFTPNASFGGRSITVSGSSVNADPELYTESKDFTIATTSLSTSTPWNYHKHFPGAITITEVWCSTDVGTTTIQLEERLKSNPNAAGTDILFAGGLLCGSGSGQVASSTMANTSIDANDVVAPEILDAQPVGGVPPKIINITVVYTLDD